MKKTNWSISCIAVRDRAIVLDVPWSRVNIGRSATRSASTYVLGAEAEADEAGGEPLQQRHPSQETDREWRRHLCVARQHAADHAVLQDHLKPLRRARRKLAPALHGFEIPLRNRTLEKPRGQNIRGGDRVLNREVDPDPTDRRHRMSGIADAQQPGAVPRSQAIHGYAQQLDIG